MKYIFLQIAVALFTFPQFGMTQDNVPGVLHFEVNKIYPAISTTSEKMSEAKTLLDLNKHYKPAWVKEYIFVEISSINAGVSMSAQSKNDTLTQEQKKLIMTADHGSDISVVVKYIPKNTLKHNEAKEMTFDFTVDPKIQAEYPGGNQSLRKYLREKAIDRIPDDIFQHYDLAAIKFTVDEEGQIINAHVFWPSRDEKIDQLLLNAVSNLPPWQPAAYENGVHVKQEFVLTVGNMKSCVVPLLNINIYREQ